MKSAGAHGIWPVNLWDSTDASPVIHPLASWVNPAPRAMPATPVSVPERAVSVIRFATMTPIAPREQHARAPAPITAETTLIALAMRAAIRGLCLFPQQPEPARSMHSPAYACQNYPQAQELPARRAPTTQHAAPIGAWKAFAPHRVCSIRIVRVG